VRYAVLSDVHANLEALDAVLEAAGQWDVLWNLGDMVGYGASPNEVLDILRPISTLTVRGNHDRVCSGLSSMVHFNPTARAAAKWTLDELSPDNLVYLRTVCKGNDAQKWREQMQGLIDAEAPDGERRRKIIANYNRGYRGFQQTYRTCTPAADLAIRRYLDEGAKIAREITARYAN